MRPELMNMLWSQVLILTFRHQITSVVPKYGSVYGGTLVTITGTGLPASDSLIVSTSRWSLDVISKTSTEIVARTIDRKVIVY